jgi:hypothetical protein
VPNEPPELAPDEPPDLWKARHDVHTIILNHENQRQLAILNGPLWPPVGAVIQLGNPNRDCFVLGVRLLIADASTPGEVSIVIEVNEGDPI